MRIAVIGGTGLMGPHLVSEATKAGHEVTCINRRGASELSASIACDRRDEEQLSGALSKIRADVVIDMIPYTRNDAEILARVLRNDSKVHLIAVSSIDVYLAYGRLHHTEPGPYQKCPIRENDALREKISFQGESYDKLAVEQIYRREFRNVSILRMPAIYGWPDRSRVLEYMKATESNDGAIRMNPHFAKWGHSRAAALDCAHAICLTIGLKGENIFNVAEKDLLSEETWCREVWKAMGFDGRIVHDDDCPVPFNADIQQEWHVDTSKIRSGLGYVEKTKRFEVLCEAIKRIKEVESGSRER